MEYLKYAEKLESLVYYVKSEIATSADSLSGRLDVSRRTVLRMIDNLRLRGVDIQYCYKKKKYFIPK